MIEAPIFILGITRRSGTNFLWKLLEQHPHVACIPTVAEDFTLEHADLLLRYADDTTAMWNAEWNFQRADQPNSFNLFSKNRRSGAEPTQLNAAR